MLIMRYNMKSPTVLCILDGWGHSNLFPHNAIAKAHTPTWDMMLKKYPNTLIQASESFVGLPHGQMGNSEVGHMNIGAGQVILQDLPRIDNAIATRQLEENTALKTLIAKLKISNGTCHILGLLSDGGVHSHLNHINAVINILKINNVNVKLHAFLDGRDTPPQSALKYIKEFEPQDFATIGGRFYGMDRDQRWERVEPAYNAIALGMGPKSTTAINALENNYNQNITDEFATPTIINNYSGMKDGDAILMANFRADRAREILTALLDSNFNHFNRHNIVSFSCAAGMTEYSSILASKMLTLFPPLEIKNTLGEVVAKAGLTQLRIAETEKYAHVTFFLNGGREEPFVGEDRILVPSPKVKTYDLKPEMSAYQLTEELLEIMHQYDLIVINYANTDMVGHTGNEKATILAVEAVDKCLGKTLERVTELGGKMLITADHGNAEEMLNEHTHEPHTAHTCNPVPCIITGVHNITLRNDGCLCDVAPTILKIMQIEKPQEMTAESLF